MKNRVSSDATLCDRRVPAVGLEERMQDFSERLKAERARLRLSQAAMAEEGGVSLNSQSNYENGHRSPDAAYLERVAVAGVDVAYLLTGVRTSARSGPAELEDWRLVPNPATAQAVLDRLTELAGSRALEGDDWQLIDQLVSRLARR